MAIIYQRKFWPAKVFFDKGYLEEKGLLWSIQLYIGKGSG